MQGEARGHEMDENNRITITVCGDGGCGMFCAFFWGEWSGGREGEVVVAEEGLEGRARCGMGWC